jgi:hypothetical protein
MILPLISPRFRYSRSVLVLKRSISATSRSVKKASTVTLLLFSPRSVISPRFTVHSRFDFLLVGPLHRVPRKEGVVCVPQSLSRHIVSSNDTHLTFSFQGFQHTPCTFLSRCAQPREKIRKSQRIGDILFVSLCQLAEPEQTSLK